MASTIEQYEKSLFRENDGNKFSKLKDKLLKDFSETEREQTISILIQYTKTGQLLHWRTFLMNDIISLVNEGETKYDEYFKWTITEPGLIYWGIDGLLKTQGENAYGTLIKIATNADVRIEERAKAIKSIAVFSKQPFDRDLPKDPGHWDVENLRIDELLEWQNDGYKKGKGYEEPIVHPSLKNPKTEFEKVVSQLNNQLEIIRSNKQDLSNPSNWLAIADENKIVEIESRWKLPENYLLFLKYYSPINVYIDSDKFYQGLWLFGADDLIRIQQGYSTDVYTGEKLKDWPVNYVVIADAGSDPYCIDIGNIKNNDAPIYTAMHGMGEWEFEKYTDTFVDFLKELIS